MKVWAFQAPSSGMERLCAVYSYLQSDSDPGFDALRLPLAVSLGIGVGTRVIVWPWPPGCGGLHIFVSFWEQC